MSPQTLRPGITRLLVIIWVVQAIIAVLWLISSIIDEGGSWIWIFAAGWVTVALSQVYRARRQAVVVNEQGIKIVSGMSGSTDIDWRIITNVSPQPSGPLVTHLSVVLDDGEVFETPLAKGDDRLIKLWQSRQATR
ncbi:hypothetical protein K0651_05425 [Ornithinimicrobium sp. Arc0846-15]|nr:hypothetical protein [Ornithinimicrobium laminariae]